MIIDAVLVWLSTLIVLVGLTPFLFSPQMRKFPNHIPMMMIFCALIYGHTSIWVIYLGREAYMCDPETPERAGGPGISNQHYWLSADRTIAQVFIRLDYINIKHIYATDILSIGV
tara:strand:- start:202 stop:546 length:345 start_codon:yes stop_codon:yes gene_type:complete